MLLQDSALQFTSDSPLLVQLLLAHPHVTHSLLLHGPNTLSGHNGGSSSRTPQTRSGEEAESTLTREVPANTRYAPQSPPLLQHTATRLMGLRDWELEGQVLCPSSKCLREGRHANHYSNVGIFKTVLI